MEARKLTKKEADSLPVGGYLRHRCGVCAYKNSKLEIWYGIDYTENGKRHRKLVSKNITAAKTALEDKRNEDRMYKRLGLPRPSKKAPLFSEFSDIYMEHHGKYKRSAKRDEWVLAEAKPFFDGNRLDEITTAQILSYRTQRTQHLKNATVNREIALLKKMFNLAIDMGYLIQNPAKSKSLTPLKEREIARPVTVAEESKLVDAARQRLKAFIVLAVETGLRRGELVALDWSRVDWRTHRIHVTNTKSGKDRWVPVTKRARNTLREIDPKPAGLVFPSLQHNLGRYWSKAVESAKIGHVRIHDLRHTFATRAVEAGVPMFVLQEWMGHSSLTTTRKYYTASESHLNDAAERMHSYWDNVRKTAEDDGKGSKSVFGEVA